MRPVDHRPGPVHARRRRGVAGQAPHPGRLVGLSHLEHHRGPERPVVRQHRPAPRRRGRRRGRLPARPVGPRPRPRRPGPAAGVRLGVLGARRPGRDLVRVSPATTPPCTPPAASGSRCRTTCSARYGAQRGARRDSWAGTLTPDDLAAAAKHGDTRGRYLGPELTRRELDVLRHITRGQSNRTIAEELGISENTVKNHVRSILEKLQAKSRAEAAVIGLRDRAASDGRPDDRGPGPLASVVRSRVRRPRRHRARRKRCPRAHGQAGARSAAAPRLADPRHARPGSRRPRRPRPPLEVPPGPSRGVPGAPRARPGGSTGRGLIRAKLPGGEGRGPLLTSPARGVGPAGGRR